MTPREQLRKMTALGEQGALDEKHWYRLVNGMSAGGGGFILKFIEFCKNHLISEDCFSEFCLFIQKLSIFFPPFPFVILIILQIYWQY